MQEVSRESCLPRHPLLPTLNACGPAGPKRFAVIGGGFAGVATAWHLIAQVDPTAAVRDLMLPYKCSMLSSLCCLLPSHVAHLPRVCSISHANHQLLATACAQQQRSLPLTPPVLQATEQGQAVQLELFDVAGLAAGGSGAAGGLLHPYTPKGRVSVPALLTFQASSAAVGRRVRPTP